MIVIKKLLFFGIITGAVGIFAILFSDWMVESTTEDLVYNSTKDIPFNKTGLLLGTSKTLLNGRTNLYYTYRINAATKLYKSGKIKYILVSGDNGSKNYDEPTTIKKDLVAKGIPSNRIFLDYAGFRTLDSVVRSKEVFGQNSITIISQQFHNERAIFIANRKGIKAVGYNAKDVSQKYGIKVKIRERFARVKMILDLIIGKQPKFLGAKITIE